MQTRALVDELQPSILHNSITNAVNCCLLPIPYPSLRTTSNTNMTVVHQVSLMSNFSCTSPSALLGGLVSPVTLVLLSGLGMLLLTLLAPTLLCLLVKLEVGSLEKPDRLALFTAKGVGMPLAPPTSLVRDLLSVVRRGVGVAVARLSSSSAGGSAFSSGSLSKLPSYVDLR